MVKNFYPVHSFLKPAAFDCGALEAPAAASSTIGTRPESDSMLAEAQLAVQEQSAAMGGSKGMQLTANARA